MKKTRKIVFIYKNSTLTDVTYHYEDGTKLKLKELMYVSDGDDNVVKMAYDVTTRMCTMMSHMLFQSDQQSYRKDILLGAIRLPGSVHVAVAASNYIDVTFNTPIRRVDNYNITGSDTPIISVGDILLNPNEKVTIIDPWSHGISIAGFNRPRPIELTYSSLCNAALRD